MGQKVFQVCKVNRVLMERWENMVKKDPEVIRDLMVQQVERENKVTLERMVKWDQKDQKVSKDLMAIQEKMEM